MANDINSVTLVGRMTRDGELKYTNSSLAVLKFSLAVNRKKKSGNDWVDEVSYFDIVLWGKQGEAIQKYLSKGKQVAVLFHGSVGSEVIKAVEGMKERPIAISIPMIQPLDFRYLLERLEGIHALITVEEHFIEGGLGTVISEWLTKEKLPFKLVRLGIKNEFIHSIKNKSGMRDLYGISSHKIRRTILETLSNE